MAAIIRPNHTSWLYETEPNLFDLQKSRTYRLRVLLIRSLLRKKEGESIVVVRHGLCRSKSIIMPQCFGLTYRAQITPNTDDHNQDTAKYGILAVQTLRNNMMASTLLASTAVMLSSVIAILMTNGASAASAVRGYGLVYGDKSELGFSIKFFSLLVCFLVSFLMNVQSVRYYSHASILINVPLKKISPYLTVDYVGRTVNMGSHFWSLGLRAFYFSFPLFLWIFGPIPMFLCCCVLVFLLYFLDVAFDWRMNGQISEEDVEGGARD